MTFHLPDAAADLIAPLQSSSSDVVGSVTSLIDKLVAVAYAERERAAYLTEALTAAKIELNAVQSELLAVRTQCQEIVDAQALQVAELRRQLAAKLVCPDVPAVTAIASARPPDSLPGELDPNPVAVLRRRNDEPVELDAIEAALAASPPAEIWSRLAG